jgi:hypothetical protein
LILRFRRWGVRQRENIKDCVWRDNRAV